MSSAIRVEDLLTAHALHRPESGYVTAEEKGDSDRWYSGLPVTQS